MVRAIRSRALAVPAVCLAWLLALAGGNAFAACSDIEYDGRPYTACEIDPAQERLQLFNLDRSGEPFRFFSSLAGELGEDGKRLTFAMNAGMYDERQRPIGLYIENGKQARKLNRRNGPGNFHLKPNGVFFVADNKAGVIETEAFLKSGIKPDHASQSGPMLVIDGEIHPRLSAKGTSRKLRNGVGALDGGRVVFVISNSAVTFHEFASLFRDTFKCRNALFLDGSVSSLYDPNSGRTESFIPLGPMVGAFELK